MKKIVQAAILAFASLPVTAQAEIVKVKANADVAAVEGAGASVFARVNHAGCAMKVAMELAPEQLMIFGDPQMGTPTTQDNPLAGQHLPIRVLIYEVTGGQAMPWAKKYQIRPPAKAAYVRV